MEQGMEKSDIESLDETEEEKEPRLRWKWT